MLLFCPCYNKEKEAEGMKVTSHMIVPVKKNGKWTTYIKEFEEDIPDLGRHCLMCNSCGEPSYPKCMEDCGVERERIEREQKKAQEKIAKHKVEIDILAGLVRDGLLKVEDAAPRVEMTVEEFEAAMKD
nr:MAG: hypothetical protein [Bacteriophage sp.]